MSNEIPTSARTLIHERDKGRCVRCGALGSALHHRRRRRVQDEHTHCACNLVTLCLTCHTSAHAHPSNMKHTGWIVSAWDDPSHRHLRHADFGWVLPTCSGHWLLTDHCHGCGKLAVTEGGWCRECLVRDLCCLSETQAARSDCGCGAAAARWLARLDARVADG